MGAGLSDLKRVVSSSGIYAVAGMAQRGLAFFLLPVYTYFIDAVEYGKLELITVSASIAFGLLMLGLPSAIMKCFHRDCKTDDDRARTLATAAWIDLPVLALGGALIFAFAPRVGSFIVGTGDAGDLVRLATINGVLSSVTALILSTLRAQERAVAYSVLTLTQFAAAMGLNITLVVYFEQGVRGVLLGNLLSNAIALPLAVAVARPSMRFSPTLMRPLLRFGVLIIPWMMTGWVVELSDRYVLRLFGDLGDVAVYAVGYKFGMVLNLVAVWPFQLAWPAVSFSISHREDHRDTYAKVLTYLAVLLGYMVVGISMLSRVLLQGLVGEQYRGAYVVVPAVALAYAFSGLQYGAAPGVHVADKTRYLTALSVVAAAVNLGLNFLLIPRWGMLGAAWATTAAFFVTSTSTAVLAQRFHGVRFESGRLIKVALVMAVVLLLGTRVEPALSAWSIGWHVVTGVVLFPLLLFLTRFFSAEERSALQQMLRRYWPFGVR